MLCYKSELNICASQDTLVGADGKEIKLQIPQGEELPSKGFDAGGCHGKPAATLSMLPLLASKSPAVALFRVPLGLLLSC